MPWIKNWIKFFCKYKNTFTLKKINNFFLFVTKTRINLKQKNSQGGVHENDAILCLDGLNVNGENFREALDKFEAIMEDKTTVGNKFSNIFN